MLRADECLVCDMKLHDNGSNYNVRARGVESGEFTAHESIYQELVRNL